MATDTTLEITGMGSYWASRLGQALERTVGDQDPVDPVGAATVRFDEDRIGEDVLGEWVPAAGFDVA